MTQQHDPRSWHKSPFSDGDTNCVEIRREGDQAVVRNSKDPDGPRVRFTGGEWRAFVEGVRAGRFGDLGL